MLSFTVSSCKQKTGLVRKLRETCVYITSSLSRTGFYVRLCSYHPVDMGSFHLCSLPNGNITHIAGGLIYIHTYTQTPLQRQYSNAVVIDQEHQRLITSFQTMCCTERLSHPICHFSSDEKKNKKRNTTAHPHARIQRKDCSMKSAVKASVQK